MIDFPVTFPIPADPSPAEVDAPAPNQPAPPAQ